MPRALLALMAVCAGLVAATCAANPNYRAKAEMAPDRGRQSRRRF